MVDFYEITNKAQIISRILAILNPNYAKYKISTPIVIGYNQAI